MASACALAMFSGKNIYNFAFVALCGALQTHFHGRGRGGKRQVQRRFLRKRGAGGKYPLSLLTAFAASSPKGTPYGNAGNFAATAKSRPLGEGGIAAGDDGRGGFRGSTVSGSPAKLAVSPEALPLGELASPTGLD